MNRKLNLFVFIIILITLLSACNSNDIATEDKNNNENNDIRNSIEFHGTDGFIYFYVNGNYHGGEIYFNDKIIDVCQNDSPDKLKLNIDDSNLIHNELFSITINIFDKNGSIIKEHKMYNCCITEDGNICENSQTVFLRNCWKYDWTQDEIDNLQALYIYGIKLEGEINKLAELINLHVLKIHAPNCSGEFSSIKNMADIESLYIFSNYIEGDIKTLKKLPNLKYLKLDVSNLTGNISVMKKLNKLEVVQLGSYYIKGNIGCFEKIDSLRSITIYNTDINGKLNIPNELEVLNLNNIFKYIVLDIKSDSSCLSKICLNKLDVNFDFNNLQKCPNLESIDIKFIDDDISIDGLGNILNLRRLYFNGKNISGDINEFMNLNDLEYIVLYDTNITGNLESISKLEKLKYLTIIESEIEGDILNIKSPKIERLCIYKSNISGNMDEMESFKNLYLINFTDTNIQGNIKEFEEFPELRLLTIKNNNIHGDISELLRCEKLKSVYISESQIYGDISVLSSHPSLEGGVIESNGKLTGKCTVPNGEIVIDETAEN